MRSTFEITLNPLPLFIFKVQEIVLHLENRAFSANFTEFSSHLHSSYLKCRYYKHKYTLFNSVKPGKSSPTSSNITFSVIKFHHEKLHMRIGNL